MHYTISNDLIERLKTHLAGAIDEVDEADALYQELQGLLDQPEEVDWKSAVLDALAETCQDAPVTMPPAGILAKIINWHVEINKSQPEGEPVAWLGHDSITTFGQMTYGFIDRRDRAIPDSWIPLFTHPAPLTPITADDVTDEMLEKLDGYDFINYAEPKALVAAAVNAYTKEKQ
jgi:hypothetical protein